MTYDVSSGTLNPTLSVCAISCTCNGSAAGMATCKVGFALKCGSNSVRDALVDIISD